MADPRPVAAPYSFALTFDLDRIRPTYHRLRRRYPPNAFWNFDHMHRFLDKHGIQATIFILDQSNPLPLLMRGRIPDAFGVYSLETVAPEVQRLRSRGVEVGIHGNWGSKLRPDRLRRQRERLSESLGIDIDLIRGNRQHYLDHAGADTFRAEVMAGLTYDASVGENYKVGAPGGRYRPYRPVSGLVEIPLAAMDTALLHFANETGGEPLQLALKALEDAREAGGVFQLCLHPHHFRPGEFSHAVAQALVEQAKNDGARFSTLGAIADTIE